MPAREGNTIPPMESTSTSQPGSARDYYDRLSRAYDLLADSSERRARDRGLELLAPQDGETVLEVGFGTGHALLELSRAVGPGGQVHGVDISAGMLAVTRDLLQREAAAAPIRLTLGDGRALPYAAGCFEAVFLSFTLELFSPAEIPTVLAEARRALRPDGRLGVVSLALTDPPKPMVSLYQWLHRHFPHFVDCQPIDVTGCLQASSFRIEGTISMEIWGLPVAAVVARPE